ncbi:MAG: Gfo/Idh/MocA family oxidoreductase [Bacteroidota bacterium]
MKTMKIGVLGCANIAEKSMIPAIIQSKEFELVAVSSRNLEKAEKFAKKFNCEAIEGYQNIIIREDIDCLYIPLPTGLHEEWVIKALNSNKHVLVEKSFAVNAESAKKMTDLAIKNKLIVMEDFMFQFHSQHKFVFDLINNDEIGDVRLFRSSFGFPPLASGNFRYNKELGGGCMLDAAAYTIKASSFILNSSISVQSANIFFDKVLNIDLYGNATLIDDKNRVSHISFGFDNYYQCNYEIWGSKGKIIAHRAFTPQPNYKPIITHEKQNYFKEYEMDEDNHFVNILKHFHNSIENNRFLFCANEVLAQSKTITNINIIANKIFI